MEMVRRKREVTRFTKLFYQVRESFEELLDFGVDDQAAVGGRLVCVVVVLMVALGGSEVLQG